MRCKGMKKNDKGMTKNCGKQAVVFFRIRYTELNRWCDNGKYEDVMGFCTECGRDKGHSIRAWGDTSWRGDRRVLNLRGIVRQIFPATEAECVDEAGDKRLHDGKREFLRIMSTKGNADLADHWEEVFKMAWEEFQVKKVMGE